MRRRNQVKVLCTHVHDGIFETEVDVWHRKSEAVRMLGDNRWVQCRLIFEYTDGEKYIYELAASE